MSYRYLLLGPLVAACASPPPPAPPSPLPTMSVAAMDDGGPQEVQPEPTYDRVGKAETFLADDWPGRERRRARLAEVGPIYWDLDAAKKGQASVPGEKESIDGPGTEVIVVERHPDHLRIVHDHPDLRITFYTPVSAFREVPRQASTLGQSDGKPFANGCGVTVPAGASLSLQPPRVDLRHVEYRSDRVLARGFVATDAIDRIYQAPDEGEVEHRCDCKLKSPVTLRDAPTGEVVAELTNDDSWSCQLRGQPDAGTQKLAVFDGAITIVGFAPTSAIEPMEPAAIGHMFGTDGGGWGSTAQSFVYLWPGDALYPPDGGSQVGQVLVRALKVEHDGDNDDGMPLVSLPLPPWDFTSFSIHPDTLKAARIKYEAWLGRVRYEKLRVTGSGPLARVERQLKWNRSGVSDCFDDALVEQPGASFRYEVDLEYTPKRPDPKLTPKGKVNDGLESCLDIVLPTRDRSLYGTGARFTLVLTPDSRID